jgi:hypothetical protein
LTLDHSSLIDEQEKTQEERESGGLAARSEGANFIMVNFSGEIESLIFVFEFEPEISRSYMSFTDVCYFIYQ